MEIEKNVPLPIAYSARKKYPLDAMEVSDSFLIECEPKDCTSTKSRVSGSLRHAEKNGRKFISRSVESGVRVWRTK